MTTSTLEWNWRGANIRLDIASSGTGPALLLLPALSSISTHHEMGPLAEHLAPRYSTVCVDWPGFGARARPQVDWTPDAYSAFLAFLLTSVVPHPHAVIAAGHAASYALKYAASAPQATTRLVLIAPTWRGPLPTVLGERRPSSRPAPPPGRSPRHWSARLSSQRQRVRRAPHGRRSRLHRSGVPDRRAATSEARRCARAGGTICLGALRHRRSRSARRARRVSRSRAARASSGPVDLRRRDAAAVTRGNGGARRHSRHSKHYAAARKALRARGVSRRGLRGHGSVPARYLYVGGSQTLRGICARRLRAPRAICIAANRWPDGKACRTWARTFRRFTARTDGHCCRCASDPQRDR